jgi:hypothetical protein
MEHLQLRRHRLLTWGGAKRAVFGGVKKHMSSQLDASSGSTYSSMSLESQHLSTHTISTPHTRTHTSHRPETHESVPGPERPPGYGLKFSKESWPVNYYRHIRHLLEKTDVINNAGEQCCPVHHMTSSWRALHLWYAKRNQIETFRNPRPVPASVTPFRGRVA